MRRKEREISESERIDEVIACCDCCRVAFAAEPAPYIVPLNFGYQRVGEKAVFYFHGAKEGLKIELLQKNRSAGFELDTDHALCAHDKACGHSFRYRSVVGWGCVSLVTDAAEKTAALRLLMKRYTARDGWTFDENALRATAVIKLEAEEMTGKARA